MLKLENGRIVVPTTNEVSEQNHKKSFADFFKSKKEKTTNQTVQESKPMLENPGYIEAVKLKDLIGQSQPVKEDVLDITPEEVFEEVKPLEVAEPLVDIPEPIEPIQEIEQDVLEEQEQESMFEIILYSKSREYRIPITNEDELNATLDEIKRCKLSYNPEDKLIDSYDMSIDLRHIEAISFRRK